MQWYLHIFSKVLSWVSSQFRFPWQFPSRNTTFSKPTTKKQCFLQCFVVRAVFQLLYCCGGGERKPTLNAGHCFGRKFSAYPTVATSKARIWLAIREFLWLLTNQNAWFVTSLHWITPLLQRITWKLNLSQSIWTK